ncbi:MULTISPECIES: hypothetical protein [Rhodanobacter]|nr:hypothetical protein [Rhodanobacter sp. 7MK24]
MTSQAANGQLGPKHRHGVRRTVLVLAIVVGAFFLLPFVQILLMK